MQLPAPRHLSALALTALLIAGCGNEADCPKCPEVPAPGEPGAAAAPEAADPAEAAKACPKCPTCQAPAEAPKPTEAPPAVPPFVLAALTGTHGLSAKLYVDTQGNIAKSCAYVTAAALPAWVLPAADAAIGKGKDLEFEVEQYRDGTQAYEVTRRVRGKLREVSLDAKTQKVRYVEDKELPLEELTGAVRAAAEKVGGFELTKYSRKMGDKETVHELYGKIGEQPWSLEVGSDGTLLSKRTHVEGALRVGR